VLLTRAIASEEGVTPALAADLLALADMDDALAETFAARGVVTLDDLAEQSVDELMDIAGMDEGRAGRLIMKAREPWFAELAKK
jgi:transcription termination/antitermination protein NusA